MISLHWKIPLTVCTLRVAIKVEYWRWDKTKTAWYLSKITLFFDITKLLHLCFHLKFHVRSHSSKPSRHFASQVYCFSQPNSKLTSEIVRFQFKFRLQMGLDIGVTYENHLNSVSVNNVFLWWRFKKILPTLVSVYTNLNCGIYILPILPFKMT